MCRTLSFKVTNGMDAAVKVMTTLRRKQFDVKGFSMFEKGNCLSELQVVIEETPGEMSFEKAVLQMKKLIDVYDIEEVC